MGKATISFEDNENGLVDIKLRIEDAQTQEENRDKYDEKSDAHKMALEVNRDLFVRFSGETPEGLTPTDLARMIQEILEEKRNEA